MGGALPSHLRCERWSVGHRLGGSQLVYAILRSDGYQSNMHVTDGKTEKGSVSNSLGKRKCASWKVERRIWDAPNFSSTLQPKTFKKWQLGTTKVFADWHQIQSFQSLLSCHRPKKTLCLSLLNVLFHLDACLLPKDDWSLAAGGPAATSRCGWSRPPTSAGAAARGPRAHLLSHTLPLLLSTLGKGNLPSSQKLWEMLHKSTDSVSWGSWGWKKASRVKG